MFSTCFLLTIIFTISQWIWLSMQVRAFSIESKPKHVENEGVSICIAARNELSNLKRLIPELRKQTFAGSWEVIVVLDRSNDGSAEFLRDQAKKFPPLSHSVQIQGDFPENESPKKHALLKAIAKSQYPLILQTDADCIPASENWISEMVSAADGANFVIGLSPYKKVKGYLNQVIQFDTAWTAGSMIRFAKWNLPYMSLGRNQLFRKQFFTEHGGYGGGIQLAYGDDDLLIQHLNPKKNCGICVTKEGQTVSIPETNWSQWLNQKLRHTLAGKNYRPWISGLLTVNYLSIPFWLCWLLMVMFASEFREAVLWIFLIRSLLFSVLFYLLAQRTGTVVKIWLLPLLDLTHSMMLIYNGFRALFTTKVEWR